MNLKEIMLANGIDNAVIDKIASELKANKIYTASEENLDIRYGKLKNDHATAQQSISELQNKIADYENLKSQNATAIEDFNKTIQEFGFTLDELAEHRDNRILFNALYMQKKVQELNSKQRKFSYRKKLF